MLRRTLEDLSTACAAELPSDHFQAGLNLSETSAPFRAQVRPARGAGGGGGWMGWGGGGGWAGGGGGGSRRIVVGRGMTG